MSLNSSVPAAALQYSFLTQFEQDFQQSSVSGWMHSNWVTICSLASLSYLLFIFGVSHLMKDREPYGLRRPLAVWSFSLAIFSIVGTLRTWPEFLHGLATRGVHYTVCDTHFLDKDHVTALWTWLFVLSKLPELVDTVFIVLRKQKLIFLHWYHHVTVLWFSWYSYVGFTSTCRWFMVMNYAVHALMYSYYGVRASGLKVPKVLAMVITTLQTLQMVVGCSINILAASYRSSGRECAVSTENLVWSFLMYTSYFYLFSRFFYLSYFKPGGNKSIKKD